MSLFAKASSESNSYSPLKPGCPVAVVLSKVGLSKEEDYNGKGTPGNLVVTFKGTSVDNAGASDFTFYKSSFDSSETQYTEDKARNEIRRIKSILDAFMPLDVANEIQQAKDAKEAFDITVKLLTACIGKPALLKVVYKKDSDKYVVLPTFEDFISTELAPRGLSLSDKGVNGIPYDRVKPLSEYGVVAGATNAMPGMPSGVPASAPAAFQAPTQAPAPAAIAAPAQVATPAFAPAAPASNVI